MAITDDGDLRGWLGDGRRWSDLTLTPTGAFKPTDLTVLPSGDVLLLERSASLLLAVQRPVHVVNGLQPDLAFGAGLAEARDVFWDSPRLERAWARPERVFLISAVEPGRSVVRALPAGSVHLIAEADGRRLYSNLADRGAAVR